MYRCVSRACFQTEQRRRTGAISTTDAVTTVEQPPPTIESEVTRRSAAGRGRTRTPLLLHHVPLLRCSCAQCPHWRLFCDPEKITDGHMLQGFERHANGLRAWYSFARANSRRAPEATLTSRL